MQSQACPTYMNEHVSKRLNQLNYSDKFHALLFFHYSIANIHHKIYDNNLSSNMNDKRQITYSRLLHDIYLIFSLQPTYHLSQVGLYKID